MLLLLRPTFCLRASLRCRSVSSGEGSEMFWFYFSSIYFARLLLWNKGGVLLKGLSQRQDMRVLVALTVNSGDKVLKGTAVQRECSGPLALLVLLNGLQHNLLLKGENWHHSMQIATTLHCQCMHEESCVTAHVGRGMCANIQAHLYMCSVNQAAYYSWSSRGETHCRHTSPLPDILLQLSPGSLHLACAPNPQRGG